MHSLNLSIYNYILIKEKVSLHRCCHENEQRIGRDASSHNFYDIGDEVLLAYGNCSEYLIEKHKNKHVRKAVAYIHSNLGEALSLEEVCSISILTAAISASSLRSRSNAPSVSMS